jgi:transposase-like protein
MRKKDKNNKDNKSITVGELNIEIHTKVILEGMEARNVCPKCNSDFLDQIKWEFLSWNRVGLTLKCHDCGGEFTHIYKLVYDQSIID